MCVNPGTEGRSFSLRTAEIQVACSLMADQALKPNYWKGQYGHLNALRMAEAYQCPDSGCRMLSFTASFFPYFSANTAKSVTQTQPHPVTIHLPPDYERANRCQTPQKACRHVLMHPRAIIRRRACFVKWLAQSNRFSITVRSLLRRTFRLVGCLCLRDG